MNQAFANPDTSKVPGSVGQVIAIGKGIPSKSWAWWATLEKRAGWGDFGPVAMVPTAFIPAAQPATDSCKLIDVPGFPSELDGPKRAAGT